MREGRQRVEIGREPLRFQPLAERALVGGELQRPAIARPGEQHAAFLAVHEVMPLHPTIVAARLVGEGQFLDQPMLGQQVERAVDRTVSDVRILAPDAFEDLTGGEMRRRLTDDLQHRGALGCVLEPLTWHDLTSRHSS